MCRYTYTYMHTRVHIYIYYLYVPTLKRLTLHFECAFNSRVKQHITNIHMF